MMQNAFCNKNVVLALCLEKQKRQTVFSQKTEGLWIGSKRGSRLWWTHLNLFHYSGIRLIRTPRGDARVSVLAFVHPLLRFLMRALKLVSLLRFCCAHFNLFYSHVFCARTLTCFIIRCFNPRTLTCSLITVNELFRSGKVARYFYIKNTTQK